MNAIQLKTGLIFRTNDNYAFEMKKGMVKKVQISAEEHEYKGKCSGVIEVAGKQITVSDFNCDANDVAAYWVE